MGSDNPFAVVVMAHLKTQETSKAPEDRGKWKFYLTKRLYEKGYHRDDVIRLFHFIDWLMKLPPEMEKALGEAIHHYEKEKNMPYISNIEKFANQEIFLSRVSSRG